jgi:Zn-dependent protease with chaperone function
MRLDTANRSFFGLIGAAFVASQVVGFGACLVGALLLYRLASDGTGAFSGEGLGVVAALLFLALVAAGTVLGVRSLVAQAVSSRRLVRHVGALSLPAPSRLADSARRARLGARVAMIESPESFSFAYGALRPRVVVSRGLLEALSEPELDAVLEHESYHVRNLDPLKVVVARALTAALFLLPALGDLRSRYLAGRELAADRRALEARGRAPLAGALLKVVGGPEWPELSTAAAIGGGQLLDARITQLEVGHEPAIGGVSRRLLVLSALGAVVLTASAAASIASSGGLDAMLRTAMPEMSTGAADLVLMSLACALPLVVVGWMLYRLLSWRAARPL